MAAANGYMMVVAAGLMWGTIGLFVNPLSALGLGSASISALRMGAGALVMLPVLLALGRKEQGDPLAYLRLNRKQALLCAVMGVFCLSLSNTCYYESMRAVGMSTASVLLYTSPIFGCILGRLFYNEKVSRAKLAALALNVCGCVLAVTNGDFSSMSFSVYGVAIGVFAGFLGALLALCGKAANRACQPLTVTFYEFAFGCVAMTALAFPLADVRAALGPTLAGLALAFGALPTSAAYILYNRGISTGVEASKIPVIASVETAATVVVGIGVYAEPAGVFKLLGIVGVLASIVVMNIDFQRVRQSRTAERLREAAGMDLGAWSAEKHAAYRAFKDGEAPVEPATTVSSRTALLASDDWEAWLAVR